MEKVDFKEYWNKIYTNKKVEELGWYEENPEQSLRLTEQCYLKNNDHILSVGTGASTIIDKLIELGYSNITATDISSTSLEKLKTRLGIEESKKVQWIVDDLVKPKKLLNIDVVDLWHDRAVLHFLTEESDQNIYFDLLENTVKPLGYVIIASFNMNGATTCSGLPIFRYDVESISSKLGNEFTLINSFDYNYTMPSGEIRPYIYTLFRRK